MAAAREQFSMLSVVVVKVGNGVPPDVPLLPALCPPDDNIAEMLLCC